MRLIDADELIMRITLIADTINKMGDPAGLVPGLLNAVSIADSAKEIDPYETVYQHELMYDDRTEDSRNWLDDSDDDEDRYSYWPETYE